MADEDLREAERLQQTEPSLENAANLLHAQARHGLATQEVWVVVNISYDYDDNHFTGGGEGGHPVSAFVSREAAEAEAARLSVAYMLQIEELEAWGEEEFISLEPGEEIAFYADYGLIYNPNLNPADADQDILQQIQTQAQLGGLTHEQLVELYQQSSLYFYTIASIKLVDGYCA